MVECTLHLGSNVGNRLTHLTRAIHSISKELGPVQKISKIYTTEAWGLTNQASFLNVALNINTAYKPRFILDSIHKFEKKIGRHRDQKWGPRIIDIDIITYGSQIIENDILKIPHCHMHNRNFVLVPLKDIIPEWNHPILKKSISQLLRDCVDDSDVNLFEL